MTKPTLHTTEAAKRLRADLKAAFPGVKFSVRSGRATLNIGWTNGPTEEQVRRVAVRYKGGQFDGMDDSYKTLDCVLDGVSYMSMVDFVFPQRLLSRDVLERVLAERLEEYGNLPAAVTQAGTQIVDRTGGTAYYEDARYGVEFCGFNSVSGFLRAEAMAWSEYPEVVQEDVPAEVPASVQADVPAPAEEVVIVKVKNIKLYRAEGMTGSYGLGEDLHFATWAEAEAALVKMRPKQFRDKVDYEVTWDDGQSVSGTVEVKAGEVPHLRQQVEEFIRFLSGTYCPPHMTQAQYEEMVAQQGRAEAATAFLATHVFHDPLPPNLGIMN